MYRMFQCFNLRKKDSRRTGRREKSLPIKTPSKRSSRSRQVSQSLKCDTSETEECSVVIHQVDSSVGNAVETGNDGPDTPDLLERTHIMSPSPDNARSEHHEDETLVIGNSRRRLFGIGSTTEEDPLILLALLASEKALELSWDPKPNGNPSHEEEAKVGALKPHTRNHSRTLDRSGNDLFEQGDLDQAFTKYEEALQLKRLALLHLYKTKRDAEEDRARALASIATSINNVAFLRHSRGQASSDVTLELYGMALRIKQEVLGPDHLSVGKTLNNIGSVYFFQRDFHQAALTYEQAREILQLRLGHDHLDVCTVTANLGDVRCSMKQWDRAVQEYRDALDLRWKLLGPADTKVVRLMEQIAELEMFINQANAPVDASATRRERFYGPIIKDVRKLQKELQRDIDNLSILESQMPMQMSKEKEIVCRELREISSGELVDLADGRVATKGNSDCSEKICNILSMEFVDIEDEFDVAKDDYYITAFSEEMPSSREFSFSKSPLTLSDDERKQALTSVKERLSAMKAKRESLSPKETAVVSVAMGDSTSSTLPIQ